MEQEIKEIKNDIREIKEQLAILINSSQRLDGHIDFINNAYGAVRRPLNYLKWSFERLTNGEEQEKDLPALPE